MNRAAIISPRHNGSLVYNVPDDTAAISGLARFSQVLTEQEELNLLLRIERFPYEHQVHRQGPRLGGIAQFGRCYLLSCGRTVPPPPIPLPILGVLERCASLAGHPPWLFDSAIVTRYEKSDPFDVHIEDRRCGGVILTLSLKTAARMELWRLSRTERRRSLTLDPRTLLVIAGKARRQLRHHVIRPVSDTWYSITFTHARILEG